MKKWKAAALAVLAVFILSSCGYSIPSDMVAIRVGAGPTEAKKVKGCVESSERKWFWQTNDKYYKYPTSERYWEASRKDSADQGRYKSVTKDNVVMLIPVTTRFTLKTDCETLTDFYNKFARRNNAYFKSSDEYTEGWTTLLSQLVGDPVDFTLDRIIQKYEWRDVWKDPATKVAIEKELLDAISASTSLLVKTANGKQYFQSFSVIIGSPDPENQELKDAVAREQSAVSDAKSKEAEANARAAQARAEREVSLAEAAKKRAEIGGFPSVDAYLKAKCIEQGCNPYQPTYLYGDVPK